VIPPARVAVLMTCHDRRALTVRCLESLRAQSGDADVALFVVDDGSSDGTTQAIRAVWPAAQVIPGDGALFWNGGMRLAWGTAARAGPFDHYLWLNDDVVLEADALDRLVSEAAGLAESDGQVIVAGSTRCPATGVVTYGGQLRENPQRPLRLTLAPPSKAPVAVDSFSGNIVLVSAAAFARLGTLSPAFIHIFGDLDYGLRARAAGIPVYAGSGSFGVCEGPDMSGTSLDPRIGRWQRLRLRWREERKIHARDWRNFVARHARAGPSRIAYSLTPWWRILLTPRIEG
jgi:GT2 family glycosyltransferase